MSRPSPATPLAQVRAWLRLKLDDGTRCPACEQFCKVYQRKLNSGMARSLIAMYRAGGTDFVHIPTEIGARSREEGKLAYWALVEEQKENRPDGGRAGYWRVTDKGEQFVLGLVKVPKYARVYDGRCLELTGDFIVIQDALGDSFDYGELMGL